MKTDEEEENLCAICLDVMSTQMSVGVLFVCRHYFHQGCISQWIKNHLHCPVCREVVPIFGGIHHCDIQRARSLWQRRGDTLSRPNMENRSMTARELRAAYDKANKEIFNGTLPSLGRGLVGPEYRGGTVRLRQDGKLVIRIPKRKPACEQKELLLKLMLDFQCEIK